MTNVEKAMQRAREVNVDYDQRKHRGPITELMADAGIAPERIAFVVTALAGYNDDCVMPPAVVTVLWGDVKSREQWLASQMQTLRRKFG